jgi:cardiolipin synthase
VSISPTGAGEALEVAVAETVAVLGGDRVQMLAAALEARPGPVSLGTIAAAAGALPTPDFRETAVPLLHAAQARQLEARTVALLLRAALASAERVRAELRVEIAWSGTPTTEVPVRLTREVLLDVVRSARSRLLIVGFAAFQVPEIELELQAAVRRGADVHLVLESDGPGRAETERLEHIAGLWVWPASHRPALADGPAALDARTAVADGQVALVTAGRFTGHGNAANMELGLLLRGGPVPKRLEEHLLALMDARVLVPL